MNPRPLGYEPNELPDCSTPRQEESKSYHPARPQSTGPRRKIERWQPARPLLTPLPSRVFCSRLRACGDRDAFPSNGSGNGGLRPDRHRLDSAGSRAAQPAPAEPSRSPSPLRVSVDLVQIDATVTDQNGRHVTDLDTADFEVFQDNRPQTISAFQYIPAGAAPRIPGEGAAAAAAASPPFAPPTRDGVRRTMAVVVDDLNLSFESIPRVRAALRRFIDEQMRPGDLVAILRTAAGMGALQQFATDRRALHAAADRVRWTMMGRNLVVRSVRARRAPRAAGEGGLRGRHARRDSVRDARHRAAARQEGNPAAVRRLSPDRRRHEIRPASWT